MYYIESLSVISLKFCNRLQKLTLRNVLNENFETVNWIEFNYSVLSFQLLIKVIDLKHFEQATNFQMSDVIGKL